MDDSHQALSEKGKRPFFSVHFLILVLVATMVANFLYFALKNEDRCWFVDTPDTVDIVLSVLMVTEGWAVVWYMIRTSRRMLAATALFVPLIVILADTTVRLLVSAYQFGSYYGWDPPWGIVALAADYVIPFAWLLFPVLLLSVSIVWGWGKWNGKVVSLRIFSRVIAVVLVIMSLWLTHDGWGVAYNHMDYVPGYCEGTVPLVETIQ